MKRLELRPEGFKCKLKECPPGLFLFNGNVCFKSEYRTPSGYVEAFCDSGEYFWGGETKAEKTGEVVVQPLVSVWIDSDEMD